MVNFGPLAAEIGPVVWGIPPANFNGFRVLALQQWASAKLSGIEQEGATYIRQGGHLVGHRPTF